MTQEKRPLIIIGASGHAKVIVDIFEKMADFQIVGLIDDKLEMGTQVLGHSVIGNTETIASLLLIHKNCLAFVAIGDNWTRHLIVNKLTESHPELEFASAIHPSAQIGKDVGIGKGVAIMAGAVVNSGTKIGDFTILNTKASLDHDCLLSPFSSLAPGTTTGGNVKIGAFSAVSISATILHGKTIGTHCVVGAGSLVVKNVNDFELVYGLPAKFIRKRDVGERYL